MLAPKHVADHVVKVIGRWIEVFDYLGKEVVLRCTCQLRRGTRSVIAVGTFSALVHGCSPEGAAITGLEGREALKLR